jgi:hypothetical protein
MIDITDRIEEFQKNPKYKDSQNIPKIHCINPYDNEALCDIFNTYNPLITFEKEYEDNNIEEFENFDDSEEIEETEYIETYDVDYDDNIFYNIKCYTCKYCKKKINNKAKVDREIDFIRHLKNFHEYNDSGIRSKDTKIYNGYEFICRKIYMKFETLKQLKEFYQFILNNIDLNVFECNDLGYVSKIFEWENNRGKSVDALDVIKNLLLSNIPNDKKYEIYDKWNKLKLNSHPLYLEYGQKILNCAIQIYDKKISRVSDQEQLFKKLIY